MATTETDSGSGRLVAEEFTLGDLAVHPARNLITSPTAETRIEAKVMDVLVALARHAGETVSRDDLAKQCWPGIIATDDVINRTISKLRKALGDDPKEPRILQTIPKRGYRLVVPASPAGGTIAARRLNLRSTGMVLALAVVLLGLLLWRLGPPPGTGGASDASPSAPPARPLSNLSGYESEADISPDGRLIAFTNWAYEGPNAQNNNIFVKEIGSGNTKLALLGDAFEQGARFSPDGKRIAYVRFGGHSCEIVVKPLDGDPGKPAADCLAGGRVTLDWIDNDSLLVSDRLSLDGPLRLMQLSLVDGARRIISDPPAQFVGDDWPAVSPDGTKAAFIRRRLDRDGDIFLVDLAGDTEQRLTNEGGEVSGLTWGPGGDNVVYASNRTGVSELWQVNATAPGPPTYVPFVGINASDPQYSPAIGTLVYTVWQSEVNVWSRPFDDGTRAPDRLISSSAWDWAPTQSSDGTQVAFLTNRTSQTEVRIRNFKTHKEVVAASFNRPFSAGLAWGPDGRVLVFSAPGAGQDLYAYDVETATLSTLVGDSSDEVWPVVSPDGEWVYFGSSRLGRWEIWRVPVSGGAAEEVTREGGYRPGGFTPDGQLVYGLRGTGGLREVDPEAGGEADYIAAPTPIHPAAWTVAGAGVYAIEGDFNAGFRLMLYPFSGGEPRAVIAELDEVFFDGPIAVDESRHVALISRIDKSGSDLWALKMP